MAAVESRPPAHLSPSLTGETFYLPQNNKSSIVKESVLAAGLSLGAVAIFTAISAEGRNAVRKGWEKIGNNLENRSLNRQQRFHDKLLKQGFF